MRSVLAILACLFWFLIPSQSFAQCNGVFNPGTVCGNDQAVAAPPRVIANPPTTSSTNTRIVNQQPEGSATVWNRVGVAITLGGTCGTNTGQGAILYETGPKILTSYAQVFKMWYANNSDVQYAESADGIHFTCYSGNPVISSPPPSGDVQGFFHSIIKNGSTYVTYTVNQTTQAVDQLTSPDGLVWTVANAGVLAKGGSGGGWEGGANIVNPFAWKEGSNWFMIYAVAAGGSGFPEGLATSSDGVTWTKYASNPVNTDSGGPFIYKSVGGTYYQWSQKNNSDIFLWSSSDLHTWTQFGISCVYCRGTTDEAAQAADPFMVEVAGKVYMYYGGVNVGGNSVTKVAIADMTLEQLITTGQTNLPSIRASAYNPLKIGFGRNGGHLNLQYGSEDTNGVTFGVVGFNTYFEGISGAFQHDVAGQPGMAVYFKNVDNTNANSKAFWTFQPTSGNPVTISAADFAAGGALKNYYIAGDHFCFGDLGVTSCDAMVSFFGSDRFGIGKGGDTLSANSWAGYLRASGADLAERAAFTGEAGFTKIWADSTTHLLSFNPNNSVAMAVAGVVATGTSAVGGNAIGGVACDTVVTTAATNAASTDTISWAFNAAPGSGWPGATIQPYVTTGDVHFLVCNPSAGSITPAAATLNWRVIR